MRPSSVGKVIRSKTGRTGPLDKHIDPRAAYLVYVHNYVRINEALRAAWDAIDEDLDARMHE